MVRVIADVRRLGIDVRALADRLWGVRLELQPGKATVMGFDQSPAAMVCIYVFFGILIISIPVLVESKDRIFVAEMLGGVLGVAMLFVQFFRFKVVLSATGIEFERCWAGIRYARLSLKLDSTTFKVWGTGDWGEEGSWPIRQFCEISPNGESRQDLAIGTPRMANTIAQFLNAQKTKFLQDGTAVA
jgi:hypothetical protein